MTQQQQYKDICITSFNTDLEWFKDWTKENKTIIKYIIIQGELCKEGKKHIQGFIQFNGKKRMDQIKKYFGDNTLHIEKRFGTVEQARDYCKQQKNGVWQEWQEYGEITLKEQGKRTDLINIRQRLIEGETLNQIRANTDSENELRLTIQYGRQLKELEYIIQQEQVKKQLIEDYNDVEWKEWQQSLIEELNNKPNNRKVKWIYDKQGNNGKSYLSKYLQLSKRVYYITGGKQQDILYGYDNEEIIIYDLARTYADNMEHIYTTIENFKNGMYLSTKYETRQRIFKIPHIIVMANYKPDKTKLSLDRWDILDISQDIEDLEVEEPFNNKQEEIEFRNEQEQYQNANIKTPKLNKCKIPIKRYIYNKYVEKYWDAKDHEWITRPDNDLEEIYI